jgi:hypothetical protein
MALERGAMRTADLNLCANPSDARAVWMGAGAFAAGGWSGEVAMTYGTVRRRGLAPIVAVAVLISACAVPQAPTTAEPARDTPALTVDVDRLVAHLRALQQIADAHDGARASGTDGFDASAEYVVMELERYGYEVDRQELTFDFFSEDEPVRVEIDAGEAWVGDEWLHAMLYSASGDVGGRLVAVGMDADGRPIGEGACDPASWGAVRAGDIAVAASGPCLRRQQVELAQDAAVAAMIATYPAWGSGETRRPTLIASDGIAIPVVAVGAEPAAALVAASRDHASARVAVQGSVETRATVNILAERRGATPEVVMIGAHLDSVLGGPGINDNGSGVAALLELSRVLGERPEADRTIRFAFWAAEEFGVVGSTAYVGGLSGDEQDDLVGYLNLDMLASPNPGRYVYDEAGAAPGSQAITDALLAQLELQGSDGVPIDLRGASDHGPFQRLGIPTGGVFSGAAEPMPGDDAEVFDGQAGEPMDPCYHLACDRLDAINAESLGTLTRAVGGALIELVSGAVDVAPE